MRRTGIKGGVTLMAMIYFMLSVIPTALAQDGEMLETTNNDLASHVVDNGSNAKVTFDTGVVLEDCPTGMSNCQVQIRWRSKKNCLGCFWSTDTGALNISQGQGSVTHCHASGNYRLQLQARVTWQAPTSQTVRIGGYYETQLGIDSSAIVSKLIPKNLINLTTGYGMGGGSELKRSTATSDQSSWYTVATSGTTYISTNC